MEIVQAYKSKNGKLFDTKEKSILEDMKEDLILALTLDQRPYSNCGYFPDRIVELIVENREKIVRILSKE